MLVNSDAVKKEIEGDESKDELGSVTEIVGRTLTASGAKCLGGTPREESAEKAIQGVLQKISNRMRGNGKEITVLLFARRRNTIADRNRSEKEEKQKVIEEWRTRPWLIPNWVNKDDEHDVRNAAGERARQQRAEGLDHQVLRKAAYDAGVTLDLETMTVHKAKGLEADYVIFVQGKDRTVQNELREEARKRALQPLLPAGASGQEEERRVWYVALTRARSGTYVVAPPSDAADTALFDELWRDEKKEYGVGKAELAEWLEPYLDDTSCPNCAAVGRTGRLVARRNQKKQTDFVGCTNYKYNDVAGRLSCRHTEKCCPVCGKGVVRRTDGTSGQCTNIECGAVIPLCGCEIPKPMMIRKNHATGKEFWGCQDYGRSESSTCGWTQQICLVESSASVAD